MVTTNPATLGRGRTRASSERHHPGASASSRWKAGQRVLRGRADRAPTAAGQIVIPSDRRQADALAAGLGGAYGDRDHRGPIQGGTGQALVDIAIPDTP
jgi:hypothetical protein